MVAGWYTEANWDLAGHAGRNGSLDYYSTGRFF